MPIRSSITWQRIGAFTVKGWMLQVHPEKEINNMRENSCFIFSNLFASMARAVVKLYYPPVFPTDMMVGGVWYRHVVCMVDLAQIYKEPDGI